MPNGGGGPAEPVHSLPDPSGTAKVLAFGLLAAVVGVALAVDALEWDRISFDPGEKTSADLAVFAGFFLASQVIERVLELVAPFIPFWTIPVTRTVETVTGGEVHRTRRDATADELVDQKKADRGFVMLSFAALLGVVASAALGLYLGDAIGMELSRWADILITGLTLSGGTKGLHELIKALQKAKGSGSPAG